MTVFAHAGHWFEGLLYLLPVFAMLGALGWSKMKARRRRTDRERDV
jgi:hypothetical protein